MTMVTRCDFPQCDNETTDDFDDYVRVTRTGEEYHGQADLCPECAERFTAGAGLPITELLTPLWDER